jgi:hypothetical protein
MTFMVKDADLDRVFDCKKVGIVAVLIPAGGALPAGIKPLPEQTWKRPFRIGHKIM